MTNLSIALIAGIVGGYTSYKYTAQLNHEAALQQQYLAAVQDFVSTGARVDAAVTGLSDNLLDGKGTLDGKREARQAIAAHTAATLSLSQVIGKGNADAYMVGLGDLRAIVDDTRDVKTALHASQGRFDLMENRQVIVNEARRRIYGVEKS